MRQTGHKDEQWIIHRHIFIGLQRRMHMYMDMCTYAGVSRRALSNQRRQCVHVRMRGGPCKGKRWGLERSSARLEELLQRLAKEGSRLEGFVKDLWEQATVE